MPKLVWLAVIALGFSERAISQPCTTQDFGISYNGHKVFSVSSTNDTCNCLNYASPGLATFERAVIATLNVETLTAVSGPILLDDEGLAGPGISPNRVVQIVDELAVGSLVSAGGVYDCGGLQGHYYTNTELAEPAACSQLDSTVAFTWLGGPCTVCGSAAIPCAGWSARWSGYLLAPFTGNVTLSIIADDGVRLWFDNQAQPLVSSWQTQNATWLTATVAMVQGRYYALRVEYFQQAFAYQLLLQWFWTGQTTVTIPPSNLCSAKGVQVDAGTSTFKGQVSFNGPVLFGLGVGSPAATTTFFSPLDLQGPVAISSTVASSSHTTGALVVAGGVGIAGALNTNGGAATGNGNVGIGGTLEVDGVTTVSSSTPSTSSVTGALLVAGGVGIQGALNTNGGSATGNGNVGIGGTLAVTGAATVTATTASTSHTTGALRVSGGVGIAGALNTNGGTASGNGNVGIGGTLSVAGLTRVASTAVSTNSSTGALIVDGGVGIGGALNTVGGTATGNGNVGVGGSLAVAGIAMVTSTTASLSHTTGALQVAGGVGITGALNTNGGTASGNGNVGIGGTLNVAGITRVTSVTASTSSATGALVVTGGVGVAGAVYAGGDLRTTANAVVGGTLSVTGSSTFAGTIGNGASALTFSSSLSVTGGKSVDVTGPVTVLQGTNGAKRFLQLQRQFPNAAGVQMTLITVNLDLFKAVIIDITGHGDFPCYGTNSIRATVSLNNGGGQFSEPGGVLQNMAVISPASGLVFSFAPVCAAGTATKNCWVAVSANRANCDVNNPNFFWAFEVTGAFNSITTP